MAGQNKVTTDHQVIRQWAEARGGRPVKVDGSIQARDSGGLRIDFVGTGQGNEALREISWNEFFAVFDAKKLAFVYQDNTEAGQISRFCKIVSRDKIAQAVIE